MPDLKNDQYAVTTWGQPESFDFVTPSGQRCLIRKLQMQDIVDLNILDQLDFLTPVAGKGPKDHQKSKKALAAELLAREASDAASLLADSDKLRDLIGIIDKILVKVVMKPDIRPDPTITARIKGAIYVSTIGFGDKMAIFGAVFDGMGEMEPFRTEPTDDVGTVQAERIVPLPPVEPVGNLSKP